VSRQGYSTWKNLIALKDNARIETIPVCNDAVTANVQHFVL